MKINKANGKIERIIFEINVYNVERFYSYLKYYAEKFMEIQYYQATDFIYYANLYEQTLPNALFVSHKKGVAFCDVIYYEDSMSLGFVPMIHVLTENLTRGFLFYNNGKLINQSVGLDWYNETPYFICKNLNKEQELFVLWLCSQIENNWYENTNFNFKYNIKYKLDCSKNIILSYFKLKNEVFKSMNNTNIPIDEFEDFFNKNRDLNRDIFIMKTCLKFKSTETTTNKFIDNYLK